MKMMNIEFEEITLIEEIIPYQLYIGYIKIKSLSEKNEFIETEHKAGAMLQALKEATK